MKVSIITATYNRGSTIVRALESSKCQTHQDIQLIVVDGASDDGTVSLVTPILGKKDILISETDSGIYEALNKGLTLAEGDIIAFLHSDDFYPDENIISKVVAAFKDDRIDVVYGDVSFFSSNDVGRTVRNYRSDVFSKKNLAWGKMPPHPAIFLRRRVYDAIGFFDESFKIAADYEFLCRMVVNLEIKSVYIPDIFVRMQTGGLSTRGLRSTILLNIEVLKALKKNKIYTNLFMIMSKYPSKLLQFLRK